MKYSLVLLACTVALAACDRGPKVDVKNASVGEVAEKVREAAGEGNLISPGRWETKVSVLDVDMPGMPPQFAARMKESIGKVQGGNLATCLTEADVKKPDSGFFARGAKNCRYEHFTMAGGKIDAAMKCTNPGPGGAPTTMSMTVAGTYSSDSYEADMTMDSSGGPRGGMKMKSHTESHRVGDCKGDEMNRQVPNVGK